MLFLSQLEMILKQLRALVASPVSIKVTDLGL